MTIFAKQTKLNTNLKEEIKERQLKEKLERDLREKEKQLQESIGKQSEMERNLFNLNMLEYQQKQENERLQKVTLTYGLVYFIMV